MRAAAGAAVTSLNAPVAARASFAGDSSDTTTPGDNIAPSCSAPYSRTPAVCAVSLCARQAAVDCTQIQLVRPPLAKAATISSVMIVRKLSDGWVTVPRP